MKKIVLNMVLLSFGLVSMAQTNSDLSGNDATGDGTGYAFEYKTAPDLNSELLNCISSLHSGSGGTWGFDSVASSAELTTAGNNLSVRVLFTVGNCLNTTGYRKAGDGIDVSATTSQKIRLELNSSASANVIVQGVFGTGGAEGGFSVNVDGDTTWNEAAAISEGDNIIDLPYWPGFSTKKEDLAAASSGQNGLFGLDFFFRDGADAGSSLPEGTIIKIKRIVVGEDVTVGFSNAAVNSSVSVYPNPATTQVNFETPLENVTIYNVVGVPVYEAQVASSVDVSSFDTGVYFVQHAAGTTRFTVQ